MVYVLNLPMQIVDWSFAKVLLCSPHCFLRRKKMKTFLESNLVSFLDILSLLTVTLQPLNKLFTPLNRMNGLKWDHESH